MRKSKALKTQDFMFVSGHKYSWQVFEIVQGIRVDKKIDFRPILEWHSRESNENQIHWWRKIEISFGTLIHSSIHIERVRPKEDGEGGVWTRNKTWKNKKKCGNFKILGPSQSLSRIPSKQKQSRTSTFKPYIAL